MDAKQIAFGFLIGAVVGIAAFRSNFCILGAATDIILVRDWRRARTWLIALSVALLGTQWLRASGTIVLDKTPYLAPAVSWLPLGLGGLLFGLGMALTGGCGNRALVRLGTGSVKSLVTVLLLGLTSAVTLHGPLAPIYRALWAVGGIPLAFPGGMDRAIAAATGVGPAAAAWAMTALVVGVAAAFCFKDAWFRASREQWLGAMIIGAMIPAAWLVTGSAAWTGADTVPQALNFVVPVGEVIVHGLTGGLNFAGATVIGVVIGAFFAAASGREFFIEKFADRADLLRHVCGAVMMGFGGTLALGCTVGQGLSGLSTLSIGSVVAVGAMFVGALCGLRYLEAGSAWGGLKLLVAYNRRVP